MAPPTQTRPQRGEHLDLTVDSLAHGGAGVARLDGYVVFVSGAVPGDRVRAVVGKAKRGYAEARTVELLEPSPDRVEPRAPHPGAPWQVLPYERQLAEKQRQVEEALSRIGGFDEPPVEPIVPAVEQWRYRNKLEYSFGHDESGRLVLGFHRPGRWNDIDDVTSDILASERIDVLRERVKQWCRDEGLTAYDRHEQTGFLRNLVVREGRRSGQIQARIVTSEGDFRVEELAALVEADGFLWTKAPGVGETTREGKTKKIAGSRTIDEELRSPDGDVLKFRVSAEAFFQTNTEMAEILYAQAAELAHLTGREKVFDLFCGIGTISLSFAGDAGEVWGIEVIEPAVADAIKNARLNGIDNVKFFAGDVRTAMRPLVEQAGKPDVVVVDPPRPGLSQKIVRRILESEPQRIVYVSCNPTTLAPNARQIADAGYELKTVRPVDMFPQTSHVECVALLERSSATP
ncbi:MAG: rRNA (uracil1939-C5)-methyltransferase [Thermoleophilaceae bacterium]|jgi:23S rRNA (uracil1939-C5)-methyltransferase|nr:rRNA (uracil1939-C5)-methyltransferase [Thermoleophilaceae bacterium]